MNYTPCACVRQWEGLSPPCPHHFFFGFALGFGFAVRAAFLKSCADGAPLLPGFLGFLPALRLALILAYRPLDGMVRQQLHQSDDGTYNKAPALTEALKDSLDHTD